MSEITYGRVTTEEDYQKVGQLCAKVFDEEVKKIIEDLYYKSPKKDINLYLYAKDSKTDNIIGTLNMLVVPFRMGNIILNVAEYGVAATDPDYQGRGINRRLTEIFLKECQLRNYNLVLLEGIPYFYRRYGFNYAVPMGGMKLRVENLDLNFSNNLRIRPAGSDDIEYILREAEKSQRETPISKFKDKKIINSQILRYQSNTLKKDYYILVKGNDRIGFFSLDSGVERLTINDVSSDLSFSDYEYILSFLVKEKLPLKKNDSEVYVEVPSKKMQSFLKTKGAVDDKHYSWQIKIIDEFRFLQDIKPVLEERLRRSVFANEEISFYYNNYRNLIKFIYYNKKLNIQKVEPYENKWDFNLTPQGAVKLFFGQKSIEEISSFLPDCQVKEELREIINILFSLQRAHFFINY